MTSFAITLAFILSFAGSVGLDPQLQSEVVHRFPHLGIDVTEIRTVDSDTGLVHRKAFGPNGGRVDINALRMEEQTLKIAARGKISPELGEKMAGALGTDILPVAFWLNAGEEPEFRNIIRQAEAAGVHPEDARRAALAEAAQFFAPLNNEFTAQLASRGCSVTYTGTSWPIVIADTPMSQIRELAAMNMVDQAYYCFPEWECENNYAQPTLRTPTVHRRGNIAGEDAVKVMVQDSGGNTATNNPYLPQVIKLNSEATSSHATGVAGNVCMQNHPNLYGGAYGLNKIYTASGWGDDDAPAAWDLGMQAGVSFGNCSWWNLTKGAIVFLDRYFDYIIRNFGVLMFKSNGNQGGTSTPYGTSPGNGYNMLCTGCYNDGDTYKWGDDAMASYSSWWNPVEGHEKPEVASPGDDVDSTSTSSPWIYYGFGGTSSASPLTMGVATLIANRNPAIITHPEAVKAILMVSAWHNVEGDAVLSDKDGAGGIHAGAADVVARDSKFETGTFNTGSFPYDKTIFCYQGDETRVICLWHSDPDAAYSTDVLKMDLDLTVLDPGNNVVATSMSSLNPFEIAAFTPTVTGNYTIRLSKQAFLGTTEPYCIAWSSRLDRGTAEVHLQGTGQIGTTMNFTFFDPYEYNEDFVGLMSLTTLPSLIDPGKGVIVPVGWNMATAACVYGWFPGFVGTLDGNGQASTSFAIPLDPGLIGITLYNTMVTVNDRTELEDTAAVVPFTIN